MAASYSSYADHRQVPSPHSRPHLPVPPHARKQSPNDFLVPSRQVSGASTPVSDFPQGGPFCRPKIQKSASSVSAQAANRARNRSNNSSRGSHSPRHWSRNSIGPDWIPEEERLWSAGNNNNNNLLVPQKSRKRAGSTGQLRFHCPGCQYPHSEGNRHDGATIQHQKSFKSSKGPNLRVCTESGQGPRHSADQGCPYPLRKTTIAYRSPCLSPVAVPSDTEVAHDFETLRINESPYVSHLRPMLDSSRFSLDGDRSPGKPPADCYDSPLSDAELSFINTPDTEDIDDICDREADPQWMALVTAIVDELLKKYLEAHPEAAANPDGVVSCPASDHNRSNTNQASGSADSGEPGRSASKQQSSKRHHDDSSNGNEDGLGKKQLNEKRVKLETKPETKPGSKEEILLLACPYCKYDPQRYSASNTTEMDYRGCSSAYLTEIYRLKQHLYRIHSRPPLYCPTCWKPFKEKQEPARDQHIRERSCQPANEPWEEKMTHEQFLRVKRRNIGESDEAKWRDIWETLFPGATQPLSIYADHLIPVSGVVGFVHEHFSEAVAVVWNETATELNLNEHFATLVSDTLALFFPSVVNAMSSRFVEQHWNTARPRTPSMNAELQLQVPPQPSNATSYSSSLSSTNPSPALAPELQPAWQYTPSRPSGQRQHRRSQLGSSSSGTGYQISPRGSGFDNIGGEGSSVTDEWMPNFDGGNFEPALETPAVHAAHEALQATGGIFAPNQWVGQQHRHTFAAPPGTIDPSMLRENNRGVPLLNVSQWPEKEQPEDGSSGQSPKHNGQQNSFGYFGKGI